MVSLNFVLFFVILFFKYNMIIEYHDWSITCYVIRNSWVYLSIKWNIYENMRYVILTLDSMFLNIRKSLLYTLSNLPTQDKMIQIQKKQIQ
jgi:hypothetical protein